MPKRPSQSEPLLPTESNSVTLNLSQVRPDKYESAIEDFKARNGQMFAYAAFCHGDMLKHVLVNAHALRRRGIFEGALCAAITSPREDDYQLPDSRLEQMFEECDRAKLLAAGQQLPKQPPLVVYRGVSGSGASRRIDGLSWTLSLGIACCCEVHDWRRDHPCVYKATIQLPEVYFYSNERGKLEVFCKPKTPKPILLSVEDIKSRAQSYKQAQFAKNCEAYRNMSGNCQDSE